MKTKLIIFDLDGTLLYTLEDLKLSVNFALEKYGLKPRSLDEIRQFAGNGIHKLIERATNNNKEKIPLCLEAFKDNYKFPYKNTYPYDGIIDVLNELRHKEFYLAILSNKADSMVKTITDVYFKGIFDTVMGETKDFPKKPSEKSTLFIINKYNLKNDEVLFIGDSEVDIQTAKNAGIECLSVSWGFKGKDFLIKSGAKIIIDNPKEILSYL